MDNKTVVKQNPDLIAQTIDEDLVILNPATGEYYGARFAGHQIWQLIAQPQSVDKLVESLMERFDAEREIIQQDVLAFLLELHKEGLILVEDA